MNRLSCSVFRKMTLVQEPGEAGDGGKEQLKLMRGQRLGDRREGKRREV